MHPRNAGYEPGNYWAVCDRCGIDHRIDELKETWDGLLVCPGDWEPRHPQEFIRAVADTIAPTGPVSPPPEDVFIEVNYLDVGQPGIPEGNFGIPTDPEIPESGGTTTPIPLENDLLVNQDEDLLNINTIPDNLDWRD